MQLDKIVEHLNSNGIDADVIGDLSIDIQQIASLLSADSMQISFLSDKRRLAELKVTQAGAVLIQSEYIDYASGTKIVVNDPYYAYALVAQLLNPLHIESQGVDASAVVAESVNLAESVSVLAQAVLAEGATVGAHTLIMQGAFVGRNVQIGQRCRIAPNVVIMQDCVIGDDVTIEAGSVIGGDGFGWANHKGSWIKVPQIGRVVIGDRVSIGNNCTIDRGAIEDTIIQDGCIIDNLVHIAHNVVLGEGCAIAGQVGFAGSTTIGKHCTIAGQAGFAGHLEITDQVHILAKAGVTHNLSKAGVYAGFPAVNASDWQKNSVRSRNLDKMAKQIKSLEKALQAIQETHN